MRELNEYTEELHRRVELKVRTQRQHRIRTLAICVPLVLCLTAGALVLLPRLSRQQTDHQAPPDAENSAIGADGAAQADGAAPVEWEEKGDGVQQDPEDGVSDQALSGDAAEAPADFSFRFVWNCYGISSYDSATGALVKTTDATHPEDYETTLLLTPAQRSEAWSLLSGLDLGRYPGEYDPYNDPASDQRVASEPNRDLILTLRADGKEITVSCRGICLGGTVQGYDERARAFLRTCDALTELLTGSPEWAALPDYEFFYE